MTSSIFEAGQIHRLRVELLRRRVVADRHRRASIRSRKSQEERLALLEGDIARLALMATTLAEAVVRKGLMTREEVRELAGEIDALDGSIDGKLDPSALRSSPPGPARKDP